MGGEIESDRKALLAGREIAAVERVRILGRRKTGILPDRPRLGEVHGRVGTAQIGCDAWIAVKTIEAVESVGAVDAFDRDAFRCEPGSGSRGRRRGWYVGEIDLGEVRNTAHFIHPNSTPSISYARESVARASQPS